MAANGTQLSDSFSIKHYIFNQATGILLPPHPQTLSRYPPLMTTLTIIVFLLLPHFVCGQDFILRKKIDSSVLAIDKTANQVLHFSKTEKLGNSKIRTLHYRFKNYNGHIGYIVRQYADRDSSVKQIFYALNSSLVYSTETIVYYFGNDSIGWSGTYYFSNGKLIDYETLGHGKSEQETWDPESEVLQNFRQATKEILRFLRSKNGG